VDYFIHFTDHQLYFDGTEFNYADAGINLLTRNWIVFQVKTQSDAAIGLAPIQFKGDGTVTPSYELVFDQTVGLSGIPYYHTPAR